MAAMPGCEIIYLSVDGWQDLWSMPLLMLLGQLLMTGGMNPSTVRDYGAHTGTCKVHVDLHRVM